MTLDEHIQRLTSNRNRSEGSMTPFELKVCLYHRNIDRAMRDQYREFPSLFEHLLGFFRDLPEDVNVVEALKLGALDAEKKEQLAKLSWWGFFATLHSLVSDAFVSASWLEDPSVISEAGPDMPEDGWQGAPVCLAAAVQTLIAYAEIKGIDLAKELDRVHEARVSPFP